MNRLFMARLTKFVMVLLLLSLSGCATFNASKEAIKESPSYNTKLYNVSVEKCWVAVKQVLLKNNFAIFNEDTNLKKIQAQKDFQKSSSLNITVMVSIDFLPVEENKTQIFLVGTEIQKKTYTSKTVTHLLIIPIPTGTNVTQSETRKTIEDKKFYEKFFKEINNELNKNEIKN